jgi:phosphatidylglycerophosphatase A
MLAFGFGSGLSTLAPGTCGTLVALPLIFLISHLPDAGYAAIVLACLLIGVPICGAAAQQLKTHDHPGIVWDEIVGMMLTLAFIPFSWTAMAVGFLLFRLFDILKPWPIRVVDQRLGGGLGIMLDDVIAAIIANIVLRLILPWL